MCVSNRAGSNHLSKTYDALIKAERLRAAHDPAALEREVARAAEEGETLREGLRVCQEEIEALIKRVDTAAAVAPAAIDDLGHQIAELVSTQERLADEPRQQLDAAIHQLKEEFGSRWAELQRTQQTERQTFAAELEQLSEAIARSIQSVDEEQRERQHLLEELSTVQAAQKDVRRQVQQLAGLSESVEAVCGRLDAVEAIPSVDAERLQTDLQRLQTDLQRLQEGIDSQRAALVASAAAAPAAQIESLRGDLDALGTSVAALAETHTRQQQLEDDVRRAQASAEEARKHIAAVEGEQTSSAETLHQQIEKLREDLLKKVNAVEKLAETAQPDPASDQGASQKAEGSDAISEEIETLRWQMEELRQSLTENVSSVQASLAGPLQAMDEIEGLRTQMGALDGVQARQQELAESVAMALANAAEAAHLTSSIEAAQASREEAFRDQIGELRQSLAEKVSFAALAEVRTQQHRFAEGVNRKQVSAQEAAQRASATDEEHASSLVLLQQQIAELQTTRETLGDELGDVQSSLAQQLGLGADIDALRTQMAPLVEAHAKRDELISAVSQARSGADEAARRIVAIEETQSSSGAELRQNVSALQTESAAWRDIEAVVKSALVREEEAARDMDALRTKVTQMTEAQQRMQELFENLLVVPASSDDSRPTSPDSEELGELTSLRRQLVALQADRLTLDAVIEGRFELLCDVIDAQLQEMKDGLSGLTDGPAESKSLAQKILPKALLRSAASIAQWRKKNR